MDAFNAFYVKHRGNALFGSAFGAILYFFLMSQQLTNTFDGLWRQNYYYSGVGEITSGRWLLPFVDKAALGLHADPITSLAALCLFVLGFIFVLELFKIERKGTGFLCMALWISSTVICNTLSYRFTSIGYALSYLLAVLGVFAAVRIKNTAVAVLSAGLSLCLSMACYQTYLGVFCIVAVFYLLLQCAKPAGEHANVFPAFTRILLSAAAGAVFYVVSLSVFLQLSNASLSDYNGANSISLWGLIAGLPANIAKAYRYFGTYYLTDALKVNRLQYFGGLYLLLALLAAVIVLYGIRVWKTDKRRLAIFIPAALLIPVACNAYMLLAGDKLELQMTAGLAMLMPLTIMMALSCEKKIPYFHIACMVFGAALLYGNAMQVWFDQEAMYEGRNSCSTIATQVISDLKSNDMLSDDYEYYFVGVPARNEYFAASEIYRRANAYAQMGNFWSSGHCLQMSYHGLINKWMGFDLPMSYRLYEDFIQEYDVGTIPSFPNDGYITMLDEDLVVIKIGEYEIHSEYSSYPN